MLPLPPTLTLFECPRDSTAPEEIPVPLLARGRAVPEGARASTRFARGAEARAEGRPVAQITFETQQSIQSRRPTRASSGVLAVSTSGP